MKRTQTSEIALRATKPSAGIREAYYKQLRSLLGDLSTSVAREVKAVYVDYEPQIAQDAKEPAKHLSDSLEKARKKWDKKFLTASEKLAYWFGRRVKAHVARSQKSALQTLASPISIGFSRGNASEDVLTAIVAENVSLIRSLASQYLTQVVSDVMQSVQNGRDLKTLAQTLNHRYAVSRRRAQTIARDQNNKATESLARANDREAGVQHGIWIHVPGRLSSRDTHKRFDGKKFDLSKGLYDADEGRYVLPAECINCNCTYRPIFSSKL